MIVIILSHTPVWVWGLLAALMALGFSQTRQRRLAPWRLLMLPLVPIFSLRYAVNVGVAFNPGWRSAPWLLLPLALLYGSLDGLFLGRSLALLKLTRAPAAGRGRPLSI